MDDAFSRRGFSRLLLGGSAGLLLGLGASPASARRAVPLLVGRVVSRLDGDGLHVELHLRARRSVMLERHRVSLAGTLTVGSETHTIAAMRDRFPTRGMMMRAGPTRPEMVAVTGEEMHYGTFAAPVPRLTGEGTGRLELRGAPVPSRFPRQSSRPALHRQLGRLVLRDTVRFAL